MFKLCQFTLSVGAIAVASLLTGCSNESTLETVRVTGKATLNGEPIPTGSVTFKAADGKTPPGGGTIKDGTYVANVPLGEKIVLIVGNKLVGQEKRYRGVPDSPTIDKYEMITPESYNAESKTPLKASITGPQEGLDFDVKGKK